MKLLTSWSFHETEDSILPAITKIVIFFSPLNIKCSIWP